MRGSSRPVNLAELNRERARRGGVPARRVLQAAGLLVVLVVLGAVGLLVQAGSPRAAALELFTAVLGRPVSADPRPVEVVVQPGENATTLANQLAADGLIHNALVFRLALRLDGLGSDLQAGHYSLRRNMSLDQIIASFAQGRMTGGYLTIPEGWRAEEIADALSQSKVTNRVEFLGEVDHPTTALPAPLPPLPPGQSLEGYLFPDSYRFETNTPAAQVVQQLVADFARHLPPDVPAGFQADGLTFEQGLTLASIVEREAVVPNERPVIASVYLNRLRRGMKLQADPTVQYAIATVDGPAGPSPAIGYWKRSLTFADLGVSSPYNTYRVVGLPPGPICEPGVASLEAVAHPAVTDYLYFVARGDGTHAFAKTLLEQQQNVAKYQP
jgi:UPF0755 protein